MQQRRDFREYADITLSDGTVLNLEAKDFTISNNSIVDGAGASALPLGEAIEKSIQIEIMNDKDQFSEYDFFGAKIKLYLKFQLSETVETLNKGTYTVVTPESYGTVISITAVDDMYKADREYDSSLVYPATAGEILQDACSKCGISLLTSTFPNSSVTVTNKPEPGDTTYRQIIGYCAMFAAGNARIDVNGYLSIIPYDMSAFESYDQLDGGTFDLDSYNLDDKVSGGTFNPWTKGDVYDGGTFLNQRDIHVLYSFKNLTVDTDDLVVTGVQVTNDDNETFMSGQEGYMFAAENPLFSGIEQSMVNYLGSRLIGLRMRKFSGDHIADPTIEFFDLAYIIDRKQNIYQTIITDVDFSYFGWTTLQNSAESTIRNSSSYYSSVSKAVVKSRKETEEQISDYDLAVQRLTSLITQSFGIFKTEEKQEDGSIIYYMHDKPTLGESQTIWRMTANAFGVSTDGGKTWNAGMDSSGNAVVNVLSAIGINFDWARGGTLTLGGQNNVNGSLRVLDANGNQIGSLNLSGVTATAGKIGGWNIGTNDLTNKIGDNNVTISNGSNQNMDFLVVETKDQNGNTVYPFWVRANGKVGINLVDQSLDTPAFSIANTDGASMSMGADGFKIDFGTSYARITYFTDGYSCRIALGQNGEDKFQADSDGMLRTRYPFTGSPNPNVWMSDSGVILRCADSSRRWKNSESEDLEDLDPEALYDLPVKTFYYNDGYLMDENCKHGKDCRCGKKFIGFIAEDVAEVYPLAADMDSEGKPKNWNGRILLPAMLKLIQRQNERIKKLEEIIDKMGVN